MRCDGAVGFNGNRAEVAAFFILRIPGVDGAQGVADFLRVDAGSAVDLVERLALVAAAAVQDEFLRWEYLLTAADADEGGYLQQNMLLSD